MGLSRFSLAFPFCFMVVVFQEAGGHYRASLVFTLTS
jgi:hypothetical protein